MPFLRGSGLCSGGVYCLRSSLCALCLAIMVRDLIHHSLFISNFRMGWQ